MLWADFLFAFIIALVFSAILAGALGWRHAGNAAAWTAIMFIFLIVFFGAWAGGVWFRPMGGRTVWGTYWIPFFVVGIIIALIVAAVWPAERGPGGGTFTRTVTPGGKTTMRGTQAKGPAAPGTETRPLAGQEGPPERPEVVEGMRGPAVLRPGEEYRESYDRETDTAGIVFGIFFWILIVSFIIAIIVGYAW